MRRFLVCALTLVMAVSFAVSAGAEKKNPDQDKKKEKKADQMRPMPIYTPRQTRTICNNLGGRYSFNGQVSGDSGSHSYGCVVGCGTHGCDLVINCNIYPSTGFKECNSKGARPKWWPIDESGEYLAGTKPTVSGLPSGGILDSSPGFSPQGPSGTGTPIVPPAPPKPRSD